MIIEWWVMGYSFTVKHKEKSMEIIKNTLNIKTLT